MMTRDTLLQMSATRRKINHDSLRIRPAGDVYHIHGELDKVSRRELIRSSVPSDSPVIFEKIGISVDGDVVSIIAFSVMRKIPFLAQECSDDFRDTIHCCFLLYEHGEFAVITKEKMGRTETGRKEWLQKLSRGEMMEYVSHDAVAHDSLSGRPLDVARNSISAQRTEGVDLEASLPTTGSSRFLVSSTGVRKNGRPRVRVTFSTSAIATPGVGRLTFQDWCKWARSILDDVTSSKTGRHNTFLKRFAQPLDMVDLPATVYPTAVFLWVESMVSEADLAKLRFFWKKKRTDEEVEVHSNAVSSVVEALREPMRVSEEGVVMSGILEGASLRRNVSSYTIDARWFRSVRVKHEGSDEVQTLTEWIRQSRCLHVMFSDMTYAYSDNRLFRDLGIMTAAAAVRAMIRPVAGIKKMMPEKRHGNGSNKDEAFSSNSLFWELESKLKDSDVLICDDDTGEWADYISISTSVPSITMVHAKAGSGNKAPSLFEVVVSQAIKNLGRRRPDPLELRDRVTRWKGKVGLKPRIIRGGNAKKAASTFQDIANRHDCVFKVVLAVTFLSKKTVDEICDKVAKNLPLGDRDNLLLWLLTGFMSQCQAVGAVPEVWCRVK